MIQNHDIEIPMDEVIVQIVQKRKVGRPRNDIITPDGVNRKNKVNVEYIKKRYKNDPVFNKKCKERGRIYRLEKKNKTQIKDSDPIE